MVGLDRDFLSTSLSEADRRIGGLGSDFLLSTSSSSSSLSSSAVMCIIKSISSFKWSNSSTSCFFRLDDFNNFRLVVVVITTSSSSSWISSFCIREEDNTVSIRGGDEIIGVAVTGTGGVHRILLCCPNLTNLGEAGGVRTHFPASAACCNDCNSLPKLMYESLLVGSTMVNFMAFFMRCRESSSSSVIDGNRPKLLLLLLSP